MGYAVDYKPTRKRTGRKQSPANKTKLRNLRAMVKYALPNIEQRCACSDTITRPELMALIGLSTEETTSPDLDMQTILSDKSGAGIHARGRVLGLKTYDCRDVAASLKRWCH